jgi:hypothetical protein
MYLLKIIYYKRLSRENTRLTQPTKYRKNESLNKESLLRLVSKV